MANIIPIQSAEIPKPDTGTHYFVKMSKDGTVLSCEVSMVGDIDQNTMELEYPVPGPTEEEKIKYALTMPDINGFDGSNEIKNTMAKERIAKPGFVLLNTWNPNTIRVHADPDYFFKTPARPVIWTLKRGTEEEAIAEAEAYLQSMLKQITVNEYPDPGVVDKIKTTKWDMVVKVYKEQYNVVED